MTKQTWTWVGAVAAMLTAACTGVRAQDAPATPAPPAAPDTTATPAAPATPDTTATPATPDATSTTGTTDTTTGTTTTTDTTTTTSTSTDTTATPMGAGSNGTSTGMSGGMMSTAPDYTLLANQNYDYSMLKQAKAVGLADEQIASISQISRLTGLSFREVLDAVMRGTTFGQIAYENNLSLDDVFDVTNEQNRIAAYMAAYENTGAMGQAHTQPLVRDAQLDEMITRVNGMMANQPQTAGASTVTFSPNPPGFGMTSAYAASDTATAPAPPAPRAETTTETETTTTTATVVHHTPARRVKTATYVSRARRQRHHTTRSPRHRVRTTRTRHQYHHVVHHTRWGS